MLVVIALSISKSKSMLLVCSYYRLIPGACWSRSPVICKTSILDRDTTTDRGQVTLAGSFFPRKNLQKNKADIKESRHQRITYSKYTCVKIKKTWTNTYLADTRDQDIWLWFWSSFAVENVRGRWRSDVSIVSHRDGRTGVSARRRLACTRFVFAQSSNNRTACVWFPCVYVVTA